VAAAVLAFVQAGVVAVASAYVLLLASTFGFLASVPGAAGAEEASALVTEATVVTVVQLLSVIALVVGGVVVLNRRSRSSWLTLVAGLAVQLALALYWLVRLLTLGGLVDDAVGSDPAGVLVVGVLFFAAAPAVGVGLLSVGAVRRWATGSDAADPR
jgi:EamA domain-containing membrane protein RarD